MRARDRDAVSAMVEKSYPKWSIEVLTLKRAEEARAAVRNSAR